MIAVTLPDGSVKSFPHSVTVYDVAQSIGAGLAKAAIAAKVNNKLVDVSYSIEQDSELCIITTKDSEGLEVLRHSCAHLLAHAVKELFPEVQVTIGPVIEDGFYYDFSFSRPFSPDDLAAIENKMAALAAEAIPVSRTVMSRNEAVDFFARLGENYKVKIIEAIPEAETLTVYHQGGFADLCRGPHAPHTGFLSAFKLTKVSGAYWRGDSNNEMLQRIYGTAWPTPAALKAYLFMLEEAEKRDHRKIGKQLDLFHFQEEAPGMVFWHGPGLIIYKTIKEYISKKVQEYGYQEIVTPQIVDAELWKKSGHWDMFKSDMFIIEADNKTFAVKPMSCPCHIETFKQGLKSYRDLPLRFAEFGCVHRNELTGAMHGLMRVRQLTQDDGHIFCMESQIETEAGLFLKLLPEVYRDFGFTDINIRLATRPEKRIGSDELWDNAEQALINSLHAAGLAFEIKPGEGAFYGPKVEFHLRDCLGRSWQCGTFQLDYSMPVRLSAYYVAEDNTKKHPVLLHRAILGSMERFIGILIEHHAGKFPLWLAPVQCVLMGISDKHLSYIKNIEKEWLQAGIRVKSDLRNEKIGFKIREHTLKCVPYLVVVGDREVENNTISARTQSGQDLGVFTLDAFLTKIKNESHAFQ